MRFPDALPLSRRIALAITSASIAMLTSATVAHAATVTWNGSIDNNWDVAGNWSSVSVPTGGDQVVIDGNYNVFRSIAVDLTSSTTTPPQVTQVYGFILRGGATFNNASGEPEYGNRTNSFRVGSGASIANDVLIDTGSTLTTDRFWLGTNPTAGSRKVTTATIKGTVIAERDFVGYRPQSASATEGGWIMHLDGGSLSSVGFSFRWSGATANTALTSHVLISNGGTMSMGNVNASWMDAAQIHYVDFIDGTGSITFNKSSGPSGLWNDLAGVQNLISGGYIRSSSGATFDITESGSTWTVTAVPEPSVYALIIGVTLLSLVLMRRKRN